MKPLEGNMPGTPRPDPVSTKRQRIAELARNCPDMAFTNLAHHIDLEWMLTAHGHTRRDGAVGVDGQTAEEYEVNLEANLQVDEWFEKEVRPRLQGEAFVIRYADDFVIGVAREDDAQRIMDVLPKRMSKYGLTVHPEKTRLVRFQPPQADSSETEERDPPEPRTFDFLGFTHYWGRSLRGAWVVKRKTAKNRLKRTLAALAEWCRKNLHLPLREQHQKLREKLHGHYGYYGIIGNYSSLQKFREGARRIWRRKLSRRRRGRSMTWPRFLRLEKRYSLPRARVVHGLMSGVAKS